MKDKPSEWIAISDLMAGVMAVVMLLLVVAVVQKSTSDLRYQQELADAKANKGDSVARMMQTLGAKLGSGEASGLMTLDRGTNRLTLRDGVFERGSACLTPEARAAIGTVQGELAHFIADNPKARILVEGYTDNLPVTRPVIDYQRFCTVYDDNFTLSAARAREARRALLGTIGDDAAKRIVVAGYGESRPLPGVDAADPKNRRVEVQFLVDQ
ncbi:OmpA/MotB family protein [Paraburkholderia atlantica]|uniref:OmpA/MotB family protein n=1 Tax=Paraburkholderia atlantica TaxID=2654982 RepID=UPI00161CB97B|nr:OmpA family protein [Paraburkholderia atlantica]MBB5414796.1 chemotaxis protein MotB [Paraburkholderia atlantica]